MLLHMAEELQVVETINRHLPDDCKQLRDGFTVGGSLLLAAIGRACKPTSKENWYQGFARYTSLAYLLNLTVSIFGTRWRQFLLQQYPLSKKT
jgi:hypothetical protein